MAKKNSIAGNVLGVGAVLIGGYVVYRWLFTPSAVQAASNGKLAGTAMYPSSSGYPGGVMVPGMGSYLGGQNQQSSALANIMASLQRLLTGQQQQQQRPQGSGSAGGGSGGGGSFGVQSQSSLASQMAAIASYSSIANNMPISELGGASLTTYVPGTSYLNDAQLSSSEIQSSLIPYQNLPLGQFADYAPSYSPSFGSDTVSTTSYDTGYIPPATYQDFPVSSTDIQPVDASSSYVPPVDVGYFDPTELDPYQSLNFS